MTHEHVFYIYEAIAFIFACCVHESAHAWTASRLGDQTARLLGRITLNPLKHIDPIGTLLVPLFTLYTSHSILGWAKPTPVDPRQFRKLVRDDILTTVAGPVSNLLIAIASMVVLAIVSLSSHTGHNIVHQLAIGKPDYDNPSVLLPLTILFYVFIDMNVLLLIFNLIPVPPLDGSHVVRHFMPEGARRIYDSLGMVGLFILFWYGGPLIGTLQDSVLSIFDGILQRL